MAASAQANLIVSRSSSMPEQRWSLKNCSPPLAVMLADGACEIRCRSVAPDIQPQSRNAQGIDQARSPFSVAEHILHPAIIVLKELKQAAQNEHVP